MDVAGLAGEAVADIVEVLFDMAADGAGGLHHHRLHFRGVGGAVSAFRPRDGGGHDLLGHLAAGADRAFDQTTRALVVIVGRSAEPGLERVVVLADEGVLDHVTDVGGAKSRSWLRAGTA